MTKQPNPSKNLESVFRALVDHGAVQRLILLEQQKQTLLLSQIVNTQLNKQLNSREQPENKQQPGPYIIHTAQIASILGLSKTYARAKARAIKKAKGKSYDEPLSVQDFCDFTLLDYNTVLHHLLG